MSIILDVTDKMLFIVNRLNLDMLDIVDPYLNLSCVGRRKKYCNDTC